MSTPTTEIIPYKRSRFQTRLPVDRLYAPSHFWMRQEETDLWRVGFTRFATRMLGDLVESGFEVKPGDRVAVGHTIGWVEGFKALTDLYCALPGTFAGGNPEAEADPSLIDKEPYGRGWLYAVHGSPDPNALSVQKYVELLDVTIDKMQGKDG